jgi:carboxypeptidase PM20D1
MKWLKRILLALILLLLIGIGWIMWNTFTFASIQTWPEPIAKIPIAPEAIEHLSQAVQIPTVSHDDPARFDSAAFERFLAFVEETYPLCDSLLDKQLVNDYGLIYHWAGTNTELEPVILMGHYDVVPVDPAGWRQPPFSGVVVNDTIWGRGTADDKINVIGILEAAEYLLGRGFQPERGFYFPFGFDEEIGGKKGAQAMAQRLHEKGLRAAFVLDEGLQITQGLVPGMEAPVALTGIAEKGFLSLALTVKIDGGHSSIPARESAIDVLAQAVVRLKENPLPARLTPPIRSFMEYLGPEMPFMQKMAFANPGLFASTIVGIYEQSGPGNALVRTTTAPTIFQAGRKDNVIPNQARATVNFRLLPGDDIAFVIKEAEKIIADERIQVEKVSHSNEASAISPVTSQAFQILTQTQKEVFPGVYTAPNVMVGGTDGRYYEILSEHVFRFAPFHLHPGNISMVHGRNERIAVTEFADAIRFYVRLMENSQTLR